MGRAQSEISIIINTLSSTYTALNNPGHGLILKPSRTTSTWATIARNMHRLLVLRGLISEGDRFPEDPWALFLREFGASEEPETQLADEPEPDSILLTSPHCDRSRQRLEPSQHVRFRLPSPSQRRERYQWS